MEMPHSHPAHWIVWGQALTIVKMTHVGDWTEVSCTCFNQYSFLNKNSLRKKELLLAHTRKPQSCTQQGRMLISLAWLQCFITGRLGWVTLESVFLSEAPASTRSWQMARWRWQAALCNAVSPLDQSTETSSEMHPTNVHLWSMKCSE